MKRRMTEDSDRNKPVSYLVVNYVLNNIKHKWVIPNTEPCRKRELLMNVDYICVTYGYYMQGYEGFRFDCQRLIDRIHIGNYDRQEMHVIVSVIGRFKGEDRYHMNLLPLINVTQLGIMIQV